MFTVKALTACTAAFAFTLAAAQEDKVRIIVRAFIPNAHPGAVGVILPVPGVAGRWMVKGPNGTSSCFDTDNRGFSNQPGASSRISTEFTLIAAAQPMIVPGAIKERFKPGHSQRLSCVTGAVEATALANAAGCSMGAPAVGGNSFQVVTTCKASNPAVKFVPEIFTPDIYYGGTFTYDKAKRTIAFKGDVGAFPSFEAYASLNGKPFVRLFVLEPGTSAGSGSLVDLWLHTNTRNVVVLPTAL